MRPDLKTHLSTYQALLEKWSKAINLVSPSTLAESKNRHFEDSLQLLPLIPENAKTLIDIGSGAGFPGLVLAIARTTLEVHLVESDQKKCAFLSTVSRETFTPVIIHNERVQNVDITKINPDIITARALASLTDLLSLTLPWTERNPEITLIFPKGEKAETEIAEARKLFEFDLKVIPSETDKKGVILVLGRIKEIR